MSSSENTWPPFFFRTQAVNGQTITIQLGRIYILPTRAGLVFTALLIGMLLISINYKLSLGYALVFILVGVGLIGMIETVQNLHGLICHFPAPKPVYAGDEAHFPISLKAEKNPTRSGLEFLIQKKQMLAVNLPENGGLLSELPIKSKRRGRQKLPKIQLESRYPLGLFRAWTYLAPEQNVIVYPQPIAFPFPHNGTDNQLGHSIPKPGDEEFEGLRPRTPSDPLQRIAWKASAALTNPDSFLTRQTQATESQELVFDWQATQDLVDTETRLSCLTYWLTESEKSALDYALSLPGYPPKTGRGAVHLNTCLTQLALFQQESP